MVDTHYVTVGGALLWTLEQGLGSAFTPDVKAAWTEVYVVLSSTMKSAAAASSARGKAKTGVRAHDLEGEPAIERQGALVRGLDRQLDVPGAVRAQQPQPLGDETRAQPPAAVGGTSADRAQLVEGLPRGDLNQACNLVAVEQRAPGRGARGDGPAKQRQRRQCERRAVAEALGEGRVRGVDSGPSSPCHRQPGGRTSAAPGTGALAGRRIVKESW